MTRTLGETAERMLDTLPPYSSESTDIRGVFDTLANELDSLDRQITGLISEDNTGELLPPRSANLLPEWERTLGLAVNPDRSIAQRRAVIASLILSLKAPGSTDVWRKTFNGLIGSGWAWTMDHATYTLTLYLPYGPPMTAPQNVSLATEPSGNALDPDTYHYAVTAVNAYGESQYEGGDGIAVTTGEGVTVSWDAPLVGTPDGYNIYRGTSEDAMFRLNSEPVTGLSYLDKEVAAIPLLFQTEVSSADAKGTLAPTESSTQADFAVTIIEVARAITPAHVNVAIGYTAGFILDVSKIGDPL